MSRPGKRRVNHRSKGTFNPDDTQHVKHTRIGVWDLYEERQAEIAHIPGSSRLEIYLEMLQSLPYVWRMFKDIGSIRSCWTLLSLYLVVEVLASLVPAGTLWCSGQMLKIVEIAVEQRTVDREFLLRIVAGRMLCTVIARILSYLKTRLAGPLNRRIKHHYSIHIFHAMARLDLPTFDDPAVQRQLEAAWSASGRTSIAWQTIEMASGVLTTGMKLVSQFGVLVAALHDQRDGLLLAALSLGQSLFDYTNSWSNGHRSGVWAATTKNSDYIRMQGMKHVVDDPAHRKEVVAGNLSEYMTSEYREATNRIADDAGDFKEMHWEYARRDRLSLSSILRQPFREMPQIAFTLRAVQYPSSIPLSLASLNLIQQTTAAFSFGLFRFLDQTGSIAEQLASVRKMYEIANIPNKILDGREPYPENEQTLETGISVEFRNVSFRYPGSEEYALHNTSFKIEQGQLCVIVGSNGSGKSTILKLMLRLYDPTEGDILIDGRNIRNLKLSDLRRAISVLFQDYTHFPLSIKDNIGLGDPEHADDEEKVQEAARLGGAEEFINRLPEGFNTYLNRPVRDYYSGIPEGTTNLFGRPVDYGRIRGMGGMEATNATSLSGGQMQRLAVSRTFMRTLVSERKVGLLLFDEPSASLDPTAEHDLFERLRNLRGSKTMLFSSHRFGNLTRHADLILYMNDSVVQEEGTHDELLHKQGQYARIWSLQAQAFLP